MSLLSNEEAILNSKDFMDSINIIIPNWSEDYGYINIKEKNGIHTLILATGGWSDNEELINELSKTMFWILYWQESKRGGYYKFVYEEKDIQKEINKLKEDEKQ